MQETTTTAQQQEDGYCFFVEFGLLGPLEVRSGESLIEIRRGLPRTILTCLLLRRGETVTSSLLAELLWGEDQPANPANALQTQISYLRKRLASGLPSRLIVTRPGGYTIDVEREAIDAHRFEQALLAASQVDHDDLVQVQDRLVGLEAAQSLWRGPALADVIGEEFALGEAARLEEMRLVGLEVRADLGLLLGAHRELVGDLAAHVGDYPLRERFHAQFMLALYRSGRQAEALRAFGRARQTLIDELGIEPGVELRDLERRILDQDPLLDGHLALEAHEVHQHQHHDLDHRGETAEVSKQQEPVARSQSAREFSSESNLPQRPAQLPASVSALVGRDVEIERVGLLLERSRLVTLTGPPGAGKSRLAIETARRQLSESDVWFVDLGDLTDPDQVAALAAAALDVPLAPSNDTLASVAALLSRRSGLLVLDTCEHVVGAVAVLVGRILREAAGVRVLATSRRPLNIAGEMAWPVPPLALPPREVVAPADLMQFASIALFAERASAVRASFELTDDNAADVAAICMALDGLPLAIELAAARVDVLSPRAIGERLLHRFDLLIDGGRDVPPRRQTLRGAVEWSIDMLDEDERSFFARLGVFAGSFDLEAASCVADVDQSAALDLLTSLIRQSMVVVVDQDRYRLLDTLAAYALEMLDQLDADATRDRHAGCFLKLAERAELGVQGAEQLFWLQQLRNDLANHRVALEWLVSTGDGVAAARFAGALGWPWILVGMLTEADRELERVLGFADLPPRERSKLLWGLSLVASSLGQTARSESLAREGVACGRSAGDIAQTAYGLNALAVVQWAVGDLESSQSTRDEAIALFEQTEARWGLAVCRVLQTRTAVDRGSADVCELADQGLAAARETTDRHLISIALGQVARLRLRTGLPREAALGAAESLQEAEAISYTEGVLGALHLLGVALAMDGQPETALRHHVRALRIASGIGHTAAMCEAIEGIACITAHSGRAEEADELFRAADCERVVRRLPRRAEEVSSAEKLGVAIEPPAHGHLDRGRRFDDVVTEILSRDQP